MPSIDLVYDAAVTLMVPTTNNGAESHHDPPR